MPELKDFEEGTVAVTANNDIVVVTGIKPSNPSNPILYTNGKTKYKGGPDFFKSIIGIAETEKLNEIEKPRVHAPQFAPEEIRDLKVGERIVIRNRRNLEVVVYDGFNPRRPKNALSVTLLNGRECKGPTGLFVRRATPEDIAKCNPDTGRL